MAKVRKSLVVKFDKAADAGMTGMDYTGMDKPMAQTLQNERIRRQIVAKRSPKPKGY